MNTGVTVVETGEAPIDDRATDRAVAVLETSERIGASLTLADVAIHFGVQEADRGQRALDALKACVPEGLKFRDHFLTRAEKVGRVALAMNGCQAKLPSATERFDQDKSFWQLMGVEDAWGAYAFDRKYFGRTELDLFGRTVPVELDWLAAASTETFVDLQKMQLNRRNLRLCTVTKTPSAVLDSVKHIADNTQKTFVHTWLPQFLHEGVQPIMTEAERQEHDYDNELTVIDAFRQRAMRIETDDNVDKQEQATLDAANRLLASGLAGEYLLQRVVHDYAARESEGLRKALPVMTIATLAAWAIEKYMPVDWLRATAKIAGSGDDILAEIKGLPSLKLSKEKLRDRLRWFVPLAGAMMMADYFVDDVGEMVNQHFSGLMYGATTVGTSAGSSIGSLSVGAERYRELVAEGKVRPEDISDPNKVARRHYIYNDPLRRGIVAGVLAGPVICAALWPWVEDKPYIYVPLGAIEPIAAAVSIQYDKRRLPHRLAKYTREQISLLNTVQPRTALQLQGS